MKCFFIFLLLLNVIDVIILIVYGDIMNNKNMRIRAKKKVLIICVLFVLIILLIGFIIFFKSKSLKVIVKRDNKIEINSKLYNTDMIKTLKNGKIISKKELVDTSKLGKKKINIKIKNYFKNNVMYSYQIRIVDTKKPVIKADDKVSVVVGDKIDLLKDVVVTDNSKEKINAKVDGEYDLNKVGSYKLFYVAVDSSHNITKKEFSLEVLKKEEKTSYKGNISFTTSKGFSGKVVNGITYIDGILIANKTYSLPTSYNPGGLTSEFNNAFSQMKSAASNDGLNIYVVSGFRSYNTQKTLYNNYVSRDGAEAADTYSARPGHSEHQSGLAADINMVDDSFEYTAEGKWLNNNAYKYGFILRYPKGKTGETGYIYESWHYRYVGVDLATKLYNGGNWISLEDYFGITSKY